MSSQNWAHSKGVGSSSSSEDKVPHRRVDDCAAVEKYYKFGNLLGEGSFGSVIEGTNLKTGQKWAIKRVNKEKAGKSSICLLEREVTILKKVHHKHIIYLNEVIESPKKMYLVMELCKFGELKDILQKDGPFTELTTRHICNDLTDAIVYLHKDGIVHRDLKLENILVANKEGDDKNPIFDIKLTDFGLSVVKGAGMSNMLDSACGTPVYMAPEVIQNHDYSQTCDIWSVGVIIYVLLSKEYPFMAESEDKLFDMIKQGNLQYKNPVWKKISNSAKDLIGRLINVDPAYRMTASEITTHPWLLGQQQGTASTNVLEMMKNFREDYDVTDDYDVTEEDNYLSENFDDEVRNNQNRSRVLGEQIKKDLYAKMNDSQTEEVIKEKPRKESNHLAPPDLYKDTSHSFQTLRINKTSTGRLKAPSQNSMSRTSNESSRKKNSNDKRNLK